MREDEGIRQLKEFLFLKDCALRTKNLNDDWIAKYIIKLETKI